MRLLPFLTCVVFTAQFKHNRLHYLIFTRHIEQTSTIQYRASFRRNFYYCPTLKALVAKTKKPVENMSQTGENVGYVL